MIRPQLFAFAAFAALGALGACAIDPSTELPDLGDPSGDPGDPAGEPGAPSGAGQGSGSAAFGTWKILDIQYQVQQTGYWCGPAATRHALSARMAPPTQQALATQLGTTVNGTDWIGQITGVLNQRLGGNYYRTIEMPNDPPTPAQRDRLWNDIVFDIESGYPIVANIVAPPNNHPPGYPNET
ncbi:MAG: C39 family peptidase, partial [Kofleriaceae bacterium]